MKQRALTLGLILGNHIRHGCVRAATLILVLLMLGMAGGISCVGLGGGAAAGGGSSLIDGTQPPGCLGFPLGFVYTNVKSNKCGASCAGNVGLRTGKACAFTILGLVEVGDMSLKAAARNAGGITKVVSVDQGVTAVMIFLYREHCLYVSGH